MPGTKDHDDVENLLLEIVRKLNPINLKTGEQCVPSEHEWVNAVEDGVQEILVMIDKKVIERGGE